MVPEPRAFAQANKPDPSKEEAEALLDVIDQHPGTIQRESGAAITWDGRFTALLLFLGLVSTAFGLALWYWLVQREDIGRLSLLFFLVPVVGLALAGLLFGERIGGIEAGGVGLTLAAIGLVLRAAPAASPVGKGPA